MHEPSTRDGSFVRLRANDYGVDQALRHIFTWFLYVKSAVDRV